jgi:hypothetical protein
MQQYVVAFVPSTWTPPDGPASTAPQAPLKVPRDG